jgi:hypothetical protein
MTERIAIVLVVGLALAIFAQAPQANSQMSLGTVATPTALTSCPARNFPCLMSLKTGPDVKVALSR